LNHQNEGHNPEGLFIAAVNIKKDEYMFCDVWVPAEGFCEGRGLGELGINWRLVIVSEVGSEEVVSIS
jgi:hypothetical protein